MRLSQRLKEMYSVEAQRGLVLSTSFLLSVKLTQIDGLLNSIASKRLSVTSEH